MTKRERTPDIDAQEIIEMFRPEMRRLKPEEVGLVSVPNTQCVASEPNVQTEITQPTDTTVTAEQPAQGISDRVGVKRHWRNTDRRFSECRKSRTANPSS